MTDTPPSDGPSQGPEFDMIGALDWKDGIATLPGSDIKFRMTEFGILEIVTDLEVKGQGAASNCETLKPVSSHTPTPPPEGQSQAGAASQSKPGSSQVKEGPGVRVEVGPSVGVGSSADTGPNGEPSSCRSCGGHVHRDALLQGKFCSSACALPSSGRSSPAEARDSQAVEGLGKRVRRKRKIYLDSGDEEEDQEEPEEKAKTTKGRRGVKITKPVTAPLSKKRAWSWPAYLEEERAVAAPVKLFKEHQSFPQSRNSFKVGMKLEGLDPSHPSLFCVLTVAEIQGYRVRLHFDGYPECYDFWANADSWDLKPAGWCEKNGHKLLLPKGCKDGEFNWSMYVKNCRGQLAPKHLFKSLNTSVTPSGFRAGMKLEAADRKNPSMICVATIAAVVEDHRLKVHFDGWSCEYDYWVETDCPDLHPVGWCQKTGHPLQYPNSTSETLAAPGQGCPTPGCNGVGHIRGPRYGTHYTQVSCPYSDINLNKEALVPDRLGGERPLTLSGPQPRGRRPDPPTNNVSQSALVPSPLEGAADPQIRKPVSGEAELSGCNNQVEPPGGANEPSHNGTRPKRMAPAPKYLKMHYVKEEMSDSKASPDSISLQQALHESVFSPGISASPPHRVALCWDKHCQLLPEVLGLTAKRVATWSAEEVAGFVRGLPGCKEHAATFKTEQIDGEAFLLLTQADIVKILSIKLGPALKIYNSILMLKNADEE
uniref:L(3)mbt-like 1b n=1 Tax=Nothobranchius kadleci TaxID=1051664 RepID=A0A1A8CYL8_NOTKA